MSTIETTRMADQSDLPPALSRKGKAMETMDDMAGLWREHPLLAGAMTIFSLSALGLPPFSGFFAKLYVFKAALHAGLEKLQQPIGILHPRLQPIGALTAEAEIGERNLPFEADRFGMVQSSSDFGIDERGMRKLD